MAKPELGTKRTCPETGKNFYDLNKDPIVSPYTDKEYPLTFFNVEVEQKKPKAEPVKTADAPEEKSDSDEEEAIEDGGPEIISLEDADEAADDDDDDLDDDEEAIADLPSVDLDDDDDDDIKPDDDSFLEEEDEDTDLSDVIGTQDGNDKDEV
ncbi:MAG: TIGR02300 family protein [Hyphomicrobiales bacterium]|nr:TIGR02300 family protein [Hyphomicrobiales bacterium]